MVVNPDLCYWVGVNTCVQHSRCLVVLLEKMTVMPFSDWAICQLHSETDETVASTVTVISRQIWSSVNNPEQTAICNAMLRCLGGGGCSRLNNETGIQPQIWGIAIFLIIVCQIMRRLQSSLCPWFPLTRFPFVAENISSDKFSFSFLGWQMKVVDDHADDDYGVHSDCDDDMGHL